MVGARQGCPLAVGYGEGENFLGSDALALAPVTRKICYLEEGDIAVLSRDTVVIHDDSGAEVAREIKLSDVDSAEVSKGNHAHFMAKEIFEQPAVIGDTLNTYFNPLSGSITLPELPFDLAAIERVTIAACGTAYYAGLVAKYWLERIAGIPVDIDVASEVRYREAPAPENAMALFVSQSGETADTLAALRHARAQGQHIVSVLNVPESSIQRESDAVLPTHAGTEIGVASTKAFTCQLTVLASLAIYLGVTRGHIDHAEEKRLTTALSEVPALAADVLNHDESIRVMAREVAKARDVLYLGRGSSFPLAMFPEGH